MQIWFVFSLMFSVLVVVFAALNSELVTINLFWANFQLSQSIVILISAIFGAAIAMFLGIFSRIKSSIRMNTLKSNLENAEAKIAEAKNKELKKVELTNVELKNAEIKNAEIRNAEIRNAEIKNDEQVL